MKISIHLSRLLAIFLVAGLVFAPFSGPANAGMAMDMGASMAAEDTFWHELAATPQLAAFRARRNG